MARRRPSGWARIASSNAQVGFEALGPPGCGPRLAAKSSLVQPAHPVQPACRASFEAKAAARGGAIGVAIPRSATAGAAAPAQAVSTHTNRSTTQQKPAESRFERRTARAWRVVARACEVRQDRVHERGRVTKGRLARACAGRRGLWPPALWAIAGLVTRSAAASAAPPGRPRASALDAGARPRCPSSGCRSADGETRSWCEHACPSLRSISVGGISRARSCGEGAHASWVAAVPSFGGSGATVAEPFTPARAVLRAPPFAACCLPLDAAILPCQLERTATVDLRMPSFRLACARLCGKDAARAVLSSAMGLTRR